MMTEIIEIAIALFKLALNPKSPLARFTTSDQDGPAPAWRDLYCVLMSCWEIVDRSRSPS